MKNTSPTYEIIPVEDTQLTKESVKERSARILGDPEFMDKVYESLCMGATLAQVAEARDLRFSDLSRFVNREENKSLFVEALDMRRKYVVDKLLEEVLKIGGSDTRRLFNEKGEMLNPHEWPDDIAGAVDSLEIKELFDKDSEGNKTLVGFTKKVKLNNKLTAIKMMGQEMNVFKDKIEHSADESLRDEILKSYKERSGSEDGK